MYVVRQIVIQVRKSDSVLCSDRLANNNLVDVIELIPVLVPERKSNYLIKCGNNEYDSLTF